MHKPKVLQVFFHYHCCVASKIFNESISSDYLNNVRAVNGIVNENIFNYAGCCSVKSFYLFVLRLFLVAVPVPPRLLRITVP